MTLWGLIWGLLIPHCVIFVVVAVNDREAIVLQLMWANEAGSVPLDTVFPPRVSADEPYRLEDLIQI